VVVGLFTTLGKGPLTGPLTKRWGEVRVIKGAMVAGAPGYLVLLATFDYVTVPTTEPAEATTNSQPCVIVSRVFV
jgi:hypothetical protein